MQKSCLIIGLAEIGNAVTANFSRSYMIVLSYHVFHIIGIYSAAQFGIILTINSCNTGIEYDRNNQWEYYAGFFEFVYSASFHENASTAKSFCFINSHTKGADGISQ